MTRRSLFQAAFAPAPAPERWWKGNLHTHTFWSDGDDFPEMVADWYRERGYHFLALTDHNVQSRGERWIRADAEALRRYRERFGGEWVQERNGQVRLKTLDEVKSRVEERDRFLLLPSEEITGKAGDGRDLHMNAINVVDELPMAVAETLPGTILRNLAAVRASAEAHGRPALFHVNHPNYKWGVTAADLAAIADLQFVEVWNGVDNDNDNGDARRPSSEAMWDQANALRLARGLRPLYGLAVDDAHDHQAGKTRARPGRAWVEVRARFLSATHLLEAMRRGAFYSSAGVKLADVAFDAPAKRLSLKLEPAAGERLTTQFIGVRAGGQKGEVLAEAGGSSPAYTLREGDLYVRAVVTSNLTPEVPSSELAFRRAWTQPVGW